MELLLLFVIIFWNSNAAKDMNYRKKTCINDVIWCLKNRIILCSICTIELFRKLDVLHKFKLKW